MFMNLTSQFDGEEVIHCDKEFLTALRSVCRSCLTQLAFVLSSVSLSMQKAIQETFRGNTLHLFHS